MTSAVPDLPVPAVVLAVAGDRAVEPVWLNQLGGVTYRLGNGPGAQYCKWQPVNAEVSLAGEARKLEWVNEYASSPRVISVGRSEDAEWLVTRALPGDSAVAPRWSADPGTAVRAVGRGLRDLHERLPVDSCPWDWHPHTRISAAEERGLLVDVSLGHPPEIDRLVVCHGDPCCPNTIVTDDGSVTGHVDFGSLGVADRWADIAVAAMSTLWNYGRGWAGELVAAYGLPVDEVRMDYYQRLWNAT